jgi:hypothetical protein
MQVVSIFKKEKNKGQNNSTNSLSQAQNDNISIDTIKPSNKVQEHSDKFS